MSTCKWIANDQPRIIGGRHSEDCYDDRCPGCQPCTEPHCRICSRAHASGTCAECLATTRETLREIARLCGSLPEEVEARGVEGEAMMLLGPTADPEARGHLEASVAAGRVPADYLAPSTSKRRPIGENHPVWVLGTWDMIYRDALDHHTPTGRITLTENVDYLDSNLTYLAGYEHVEFEKFAGELKACRTHLESVLHDGEQRDTGAPCMTCNIPLVRVWGDDERADGWRCPKCRQTSTEDQYRVAVKHLHREEATHLTDRDMELRTGVKAGTVRVWANRGDVERKRESGRTVYAVQDVLRRARGEVVAG